MSSVKCRNYVNAKCLKCERVQEEMVRIGALVMCYDCWQEEFKGKDEIDCDSDLYNVTYRKWLKKYSKE